MAAFQTLTARVTTLPVLLFAPIKFKHWWHRLYYRLAQRSIIKSISQDIDYVKLLENAQVIDRCIADLKSTCADINATLVAYGNSSLSRKMAAHTNRMMLRISIMERGGM